MTYFEHLATQPANRWHGFYTPQREDSHFGLRYQLAFPCYALASIGLHPQAASSEQHRCRSAMAALIDRMIQRRVWAYWASDAEQAGLNPDPVLDGNGQYSGHLAMMMGVYEAVGGDRRYDEAFTFRWSPLERFTYTHSSLVQALWQQMQSNSHHGVEAQARQVRVSDMMHTLWAMLLHDRVHGTSYAATNAAWLAFMRQQLILRELPLLGRRGIFNPCYTTRPHLFTPAALSVVDAWTLALLAPLDAALTATLAPRLLRRVRQRSTADSPTMQAYLPAARGWRASEIATRQPVQALPICVPSNVAMND
ncbi:MAG: hypothetical protein HC893_15380 [Chloroflexaceae bacterium]|nr:hypothetical protein [Chloroflexaceae bacterium]